MSETHSSTSQNGCSSNETVLSSNLSEAEENLPLTYVLHHKGYALLRTAKTLKNKIDVTLWPGSIFNLALTTGLITAIRLTKINILEPVTSRMVSLERVLPVKSDVSRLALSCTLTGLVLFWLLTWARRLLIRNLLAYRSWMYEDAKSHSTSTLAWGIALKALFGWKAPLYGYQASLPRMPVPPLEETISQLLLSLEPVLAEQPEKMEEFREEAAEFQKTLGPKLQKALTLKSWWADNYVSDWWVKYVYLMGRSPLVVNSNYYVLDQCYWTPTKLQTARAAGTVFQMLKVRNQIESGDFEPLVIRNTIPVCMEQYRRVFSTTRVPQEEIDTLEHYPASESQHIVVNRRGLLYKVDITDQYGGLVSPVDLEKQLDWILEDADNRYASVSESERLVPVMTSIDRTTWAKSRSEYLLSNGINRETLRWVESAVMMVHLDTRSFPDLSGRATHLLHGDVGQMWFDKSMQIVAFTDGHVGLNCEHSYADAPVIAHIFEFNLTYDVIKSLYDEEGHCTNKHEAHIPIKVKSKPTLLQWEVNDQFSNVISRACRQADKNMSDLDLVLFDHTAFGKGVMKKCKHSPDAFIQMALHTTYRKLHNKPVLTYEASMTRLYKDGRTETVRSLSKEADAFVRAMTDGKETSKANKRGLLKKACEVHARMYKDAMNGRGIDRHLFALYVASRGMGTDCEFLKKVLSLPWTLSTSQQPQQQIWWSPGCGDPKYHDYLCPGGGFGPVADDGYGVSYMVPGDLRVFFHVTSRKSAPATSSQKFMDTLKETLQEMKDLHEGV